MGAELGIITVESLFMKVYMGESNGNHFSIGRWWRSRCRLYRCYQNPEKHDFKIKAIAGTSAADAGAVYAAGFSTDDIEAAFNEMKHDWSFTRNSNDNPLLLGLSSIATKLKNLLGDRTFDDLLIPFAATAVSLNTGNEII